MLKKYIKNKEKMNIFVLISLALNFFISLSLLSQEDSIKTSSLSFVKSSIFNSFTEKITFSLIILNFAFLLMQTKFNLF